MKDAEVETRRRPDFQKASWMRRNRDVPTRGHEVDKSVGAFCFFKYGEYVRILGRLLTWVWSVMNSISRCTLFSGKWELELKIHLLIMAWSSGDHPRPGCSPRFASLEQKMFLSALIT